MATSSINSIVSNSGTTQVPMTGAAGMKNPMDITSSDFMTLLLTQLKHQDPMDPVDSNDLLGQMAQLNMLTTMQAIQESMAQLNQANQLNYAASLIGKTITAVPDPNNPSETITGLVTSTTISGGEAMVQVDGMDIDVSTIVQVSAGE